MTWLTRSAEGFTTRDDCPWYICVAVSGHRCFHPHRVVVDETTGRDGCTWENHRVPPRCPCRGPWGTHVEFLSRAKGK